MNIIDKILQYLNRQQKLSVVTSTDISAEKHKENAQEKKAKEIHVSLPSNQFWPGI